jgi:hypothetical protein
MIDDMLKTVNTGIYKARLPSVTAKIDEIASSLDVPPHLVQYEVQLNIVSRFTVDPRKEMDLHAKREHAVKALKYRLYDDFITDIYDMLANCDDRDVLAICNKMLKRIGL